MAYIETIHESQATGDLADLYKRAGNPDGSVDNVMKIHALNPETLRTHFEMYRQCMHLPSPLSRGDREMVAVVVSRLNGCRYCLEHHLTGLKRLWPDERAREADNLSTGRLADLTDRETAMVQFATKITMNPQDMEESDVQRVRHAGLDDRSILDLAQCIGYFNYVNRIVTGLGVQIGDGEGPIGQWPE